MTGWAGTGCAMVDGVVEGAAGFGSEVAAERFGAGDLGGIERHRRPHAATQDPKLVDDGNLGRAGFSFKPAY
jgi:hypothetical protein